VLIFAFIVALLLGLATHALADTAPSVGAAADPSASPVPAASVTVTPEIGRVVTSDRHQENAAQAARPTYVVTQQEMEARGDLTVANALVGVPGVNLSRYGPYGAAVMDYGLRGSNAKQTLVLLDGLPIEDGSTGFIDLDKLSTVDIERIEIVEGGASTLYGTGAVGGVINIITSVPRDAYLSLLDGTLGERSAQVAYGNGTIGGSLERHVATNSYSYPSLDNIPGGTIPVGGDDAETSIGRLSYQQNYGSGWAFLTTIGANATNEDFVGANPPPTLANVGRTQESEDDLRSVLSHSSSNAVASLSLGYSRQDYYSSFPGAPWEENIDGRVQLSLRNVVGSGAGTFVYGTDLTRASALNNLAGTQPVGFPSITGASGGQAAFYGQYQYLFPNKSEVYGGLRYEHDSPYGSVIAPGFGGILTLAPGLNVAANASEGYRVPTLDDISFPGSNNPNIKPERTSNYDVTLRAPNLGGGVTFGWFGMDATNLIEYIFLNPVYNYYPINVGLARIQGLTFTAQTPTFHGFQAYANATNVYEAADLTPGTASP
jgi:vitamin B12 transporter